MAFPFVIQPIALDGTNGFALAGTSGGVGQAVTAIGDFNGDGLADFLVTASMADPLGRYDAGAAFIVFGSGQPWGATFDLGSIDETNGRRLVGASIGDQAGFAAASAGDVNGDGLADLIIGARNGGVDSYGAAYVVFGTSSGMGDIDLGALDGTNGFGLVGDPTSDSLGSSVTAIGDINGDGLVDLLVGAPNGNLGGPSSGLALVVFGTTTPSSSPIDLADIEADPSLGFLITSQQDGGLLGFATSGLGDINGDGFDDFAVSAPIAASGAVYVVFGKGTGGWTDLDLADLDGQNGFQLTGQTDFDQAGLSIAGIGDFNGDEVDDLAIAAPGENAVYVLFGTRHGFAASLSVDALDGSNGFRVSGQGVSLGAGDINGDGLADLFIGAVDEVYVLFGTTAALSANVVVNASNGFVVPATNAGDELGRSVAGAGDINGDGIDDLILGAPGYAAGDGRAYVIFGQSDPVLFAGGAGDENVRGAGRADDLSGGDGKDILRGLGADDILDGGAGNDILYGGVGTDDIVGGLGNDWLQGDDGDDLLSGGDGADKLFGGFGADDMVGGAGNDRFDGGVGADQLTGGDGNDYLDGGAGSDSLTGGLGNDVYIVDTIGDLTIEASDAGYDIVRTALGGLTLAANIEGLELQGAADIAGSGNAGSNNLQGNSGSNTLFGNGGVDTINGNDGDDFIVGGAGNDLLRGGTGADTFIVGPESAGGGVLETDQVYDFSAPEGDIVDLSGLYAGTLALVSSFNKAAGQMTLSFAGGITTLRVDLNGDGKVDYQMKINGDVTGESGDWIF